MPEPTAPPRPASPPAGRRGPPTRRRVRRLGGFLIVGLVVTLALAVVVSPYASSEPDGLEKVAADQGIDADADEHALGDSPLADYGVEGVDDPDLGTSLAGLIGVLVTFAVGAGLFLTARHRRRPPSPHPSG
jgi:cobalt/nickel transport system permease protein